MMQPKIERFIKIYPWYAGFVGDLLFYIAIDTLFLTIVKNFSPAQMVSLTSVSQLACILGNFVAIFDVGGYRDIVDNCFGGSVPQYETLWNGCNSKSNTIGCRISAVMAVGFDAGTVIM